MDFASSLFQNFNVILKQGEAVNLFKHAASGPFYILVEYFSTIKFWLLYMKPDDEGEHKALYLTQNLKVVKFLKDGNEILLTYDINKEHYLVTNRFLVGLN